jgi:hypothetical protein
MQGKNKKKAETDLSQERLEDLVHEAMLGLGWVLPVTPEDVARVEAELEEDTTELPPALRDPYAVFDSAKQCAPAEPSLPVNDEVVECLGRVAREGKKIPPEVEKRMQQDRENAERDADE